MMRIDKRKLGDARGHFSRLFCNQELAGAGLDMEIAQINHSYSARKGTLRGMHFQYPPASEVKIVSCLRGRILDVAVDLREGSDSFGRWTAVELSAENWCSLYIPPGFAHGFQTLEPDVELLYLHSAPYTPDCEGGVNPLDDEIGIKWPLDVTEISPRDQALPTLRNLPRKISPDAATAPPR
ncbi:dTDP-4-dehydrorhamnose 3,5-epimerase [Profundibacter amoris]|uniref:dTDP-4-dehydrorhamnose 3,5-epimerase n=1 Tax=Profundibacter amoris TaxID=2171755 RepID=A0A347ULK4_9RHOB|nr:dTDP-4-dehydrorhamnose 3,5-epimerase [Profundibacter amoris]